MTRPRVSADKRQRTAQACESCKRRKQKCNGIQPCNTCTKRNLICNFGIEPSEHGSDEQSPPAKRQVTDQIQSPQSYLTSPTALQSPPMTTGSTNPLNAIPSFQVSQSLIKDSPSNHSVQSIGHFPTPPARQHVFQPPGQTLAIPEKGTDPVGGENDSIKEGSGQDEEARDYHSFRMLQDPTGRLLYIGDSASLSYLQLIRMYVESISGPSPFTLDPRRHRIVENGFTLPANIRNTHLLPDKITAQVLVDSFFLNTSGFIQVVNRRTFMITLENCYSDPLHVGPSWLCLLNLIFAIGLVLASPSPGTPEDVVVRKLRADEIDRAEMFYVSAKGLGDPISGFEDADFWSVQALLLMTLYMLAVSKRNAAYAYCGMAIRSGFALGLHRNDTLVIFEEEEQTVRRNIWRSLFIVDAFLATSLGRPTSIANEDCTIVPLKVELPTYGADMSHTSSLGVEASVRSCQVVGTILKTIYSKRKCDAKTAQSIIEQCKPWSKTLHHSLHWRQMTQLSNLDPSHGIAILHVNLLYCHTVILLTRPFFIDLMATVARERSNHIIRSQKIGIRMERHSDACVSAAIQSIVLVQIARDGNYLSRRNPFVLYFLFAAALVVLSNEFFALHDTGGRGTSAINSSISIMSYCSQTDPLADRLVFILTSFRDVVVRQNQKMGEQPQLYGTRMFRFISSGHEDPITGFFNPDSTTKSGSRFDGPGAPSSVFGGRSPNNSSIPNSGSMSIASLIMQTGSSSNNIPTSVSMQLQSSASSITGAGPSPPNSTTRHGSVDDANSLEGEIDFENLWNLQGMSTPAVVGKASFGAEDAATMGGGLGMGMATGIGAERGTGGTGRAGTAGRGAGTGVGATSMQSISDSAMPPFGMKDFRTS